jgi:hypothetical protein
MVNLTAGNGRSFLPKVTESSSILSIMISYLISTASIMNYPAAELRGIGGTRQRDYAPSPCPLPPGAREQVTPQQSCEESLD